MSFALPSFSPQQALARLRTYVEAMDGRAVVAVVEAEPSLFDAIAAGARDLGGEVELVAVTAATPDAAIDTLNLRRDVILGTHTLVGFLVADVVQLRRVVNMAPDLVSTADLMIHVEHPPVVRPWAEVKQDLFALAEREIGAGVPWPDGSGLTVIPWDLVSQTRPARSGGVFAGPPGSGRTSMLKLFAWRVLQKGEAVPLVVSLREWARSRRELLSTFPEFLARWLAQRGVVGPLDLDGLAPQMALFLDGLEHLDADARADLARSTPSKVGYDEPHFWWSLVVLTATEESIPRSWKFPRWAEFGWLLPRIGSPPTNPRGDVESALSVLRPGVLFSDADRVELLRSLVEVPEFAAVAAVPLLLAGAMHVWLTSGRFPIDRWEILAKVAEDPRFQDHEAVVGWRLAERAASEPREGDPELLLDLEFVDSVRALRSWRVNGLSTFVTQFVAGAVNRAGATDTVPALRWLAELLAEQNVWTATDRLALLRVFLRTLVSRSHDHREQASLEDVADQVLLGPGALAMADELKGAAQEVLVDGALLPEALRFPVPDQHDLPPYPPGLAGVLLAVLRRCGLNAEPLLHAVISPGAPFEVEWARLALLGAR